MMNAGDDDIHLAGPELWWREAWYWGFYDPITQIQLVIYTGVFPNQEHGDLLLTLHANRRLVFRTVKLDYHISKDIGYDRWAFSCFQQRMLEPMRRWKLYFEDDECRINLDYEAVHEPFSWAEARLFMEREAPGESSRHYDQVGRFRGEISWNGKSCRIDALGMRDHMWGWGSRAKWKTYLMMWPIFDKNLVLNIFPQAFVDGSQQMVGYLWESDQRRLLKHGAFEFAWPSAGRMVNSIYAQVEDERGRVFTLEAVPLNLLDTSGIWPNRVGHLIYGEGEFHFGGKTGYGELGYYYLEEAERPTHWIVGTEKEVLK
ncbi:MAG: hypothetical protein HY314_00025 [Acidobacteria bacterium]|nr:hypothetical protein [Acidobacteriota bacterium]